jgi:hypothetical protein
MFLIESIKGYLARETARREGRRYAYKIIREPARREWLRGRLTSLIKDFRHLNATIIKYHKSSLFSGDTVAKPEDFVQAADASTFDGFRSFLVTINMLTVEDIEATAKRAKKKDFFFVTMRTLTPSLFDALHRVRVYRNSFAHNKLNPEVERNRDEYLSRDLGAVKVTLTAEECMILQQIILDELFFAVQDELSKLAS